MSTQIFVKSPSGRTFAVKTVDFHDYLVLGVKLFIQAQEGHPLDTQQLFFNGQRLEDLKHFSDYSIQPNDTLTLVLEEGGEGDFPITVHWNEWQGSREVDRHETVVMVNGFTTVQELKTMIAGFCGRDADTLVLEHCESSFLKMKDGFCLNVYNIQKNHNVILLQPDDV